MKRNSPCQPIVLTFELNESMAIYRSTPPLKVGLVMNDLRKSQALAAWQKLFNQPEIRMDVEEQYEALLRLADDFEEEGIISREERRELIEKATVFYAQSVAGVGEGT